MAKKNVCELSKYKRLIPLYIEAKEKFSEEIDKLEETIFGNLDKEKRKIESKLEKEFQELWKTFGIKGYIFEKFRFYIDMCHGPHHYFHIMALNTPTENLDLENIANQYPTNKRKEDTLRRIDRQYLITEGKIENEIDNIGFSGGALPKKIKEFLNFNGILIPYARYFKKD